MKNKADKARLILVPLLTLFIGSTGLTEEPEDYRFPRECTLTPDGYPVPLCGRPLTKTPVVVKQEGATLSTYPEYFIPEQEELAANEMRITTIGSGNPPVRRGQASTSLTVYSIFQRIPAFSEKLSKLSPQF